MAETLTIFRERIDIMENNSYYQEYFTARSPHVLIKVILKPDYGLVRNGRNRVQNHIFGFVSEKTNSQHLFLKPRSFDDRITHNVYDDGDARDSHGNSEFHIWYGDIEWVYVETRKFNSGMEQNTTSTTPQQKHEII